MKTNDKARKWMWWFLGTLALLQVYFVQELLAAFALFAIGFVAIGLVIGSLFMLHRGLAITVDRVADSGHPFVLAARQGGFAIEDMARRPFRRTGSAAAR